MLAMILMAVLGVIGVVGNQAGGMWGSVQSELDSHGFGQVPN